MIFACIRAVVTEVGGRVSLDARLCAWRICREMQRAVRRAFYLFLFL